MCAGRIDAPYQAIDGMKAAHGAFRRIVTVCGSGVSTPASRCASSLLDDSDIRANVERTSSDVSGLPSWKVTPLRKEKVYESPSAAWVQRSASSGRTLPSSVRVTRRLK